MKFALPDETAPRVVSGRRTGDIRFQRLLQGSPDAPDNYELSIVTNRGSYYTPRHSHNFEQARYVIEGSFNYAGRKAMKAGTGGYFPEGTYCGPQTAADCTTLVLQCAGPWARASCPTTSSMAAISR